MRKHPVWREESVYPYEQPKEGVEGRACVTPGCKRGAKEWCLFGRSY